MSTVETAVSTVAKRRLDRAVQHHKITQARENQLLSNLNTRLPKLFARTPGQHGQHRATGSQSTTTQTTATTPSLS